jgi:L-asparaginase
MVLQAQSRPLRASMSVRKRTSRGKALPIPLPMADNCAPSGREASIAGRATMIAIFTTGGTIDKIYFDAKGAYPIGAPLVDQLLAQARVEQPCTITPLLRKDSLELTDADRADIVAAVTASAATQVIITHGTDTMVDTGAALAGVAGKTIVLTGALQPGRFADSDAPFNLGMAVAAVQVLPPGVYIAVNGLVLPAGSVRKNREQNRFEAIAPD